ncbi:MAG: hypothetical protein A2X56_11325 [Nitrospirae bacterium GWC2_57_13]|nr:MAG: hypothetical protein A2X56_11325 [Nitrospirae bacterium GWC2_57_13]HAS55318.1 hypothetical protein [Nitrospiraceae bacterium]
MRETSETSEVLTVLRREGPRWVGIDGVDGSGKSSLAALLSRELGWPHINLDDYVEQNMGQFVEHLHYDDVRDILNKANEPIIIEGVCLLAVLERLEQRLDLLIYVKKVASYGMWYDEDDCAVSGDIDDFMNEKREKLQKFVEMEALMNSEEPQTDVEFPKLAEEIIRYHYKYRPHEKADIVYIRVDR